MEKLNDFLSPLFAGRELVSPLVLQSLALFLLGLFIAYAARILFSFSLKRVFRLFKFKLETKNLFEDQAESLIRLLSQSLFMVLVFIAALMAMSVLGFPLFSKWLSSLSHYVPKILLALLIIFMGYKISQISKDLLLVTLRKTGSPFVLNASRIFGFSVFLVSVMVALEELDINVRFLTEVLTLILGVSFGSVCLAFALGAKNSIANLLENYYLKKHLGPGQTVEIDGRRGTIDRITATHFFIKVEDGIWMLRAEELNKRSLILLSG